MRIWTCDAGTNSFRRDEPICGEVFETHHDFEQHMAIAHGCRTCTEPSSFKPSHFALESCRSGRYAHCTCDGCF